MATCARIRLPSLFLHLILNLFSKKSDQPSNYGISRTSCGGNSTVCKPPTKVAFKPTFAKDLLIPRNDLRPGHSIWRSNGVDAGTGFSRGVIRMMKMEGRKVIGDQRWDLVKKLEFLSVYI